MYMRIALYISPAHSVPPETRQILAPWYLVREIANGLVERGHEVTLFAAQGSKTKAHLIDLGIAPFGYKEGAEIEQKKFINYAASFEQRLAAEMYKMSQEGKFDVINSHWSIRTLPFAVLTKTPSVFTLHDPLNDLVLEMYSAYLDIPQISYISISNAQRGNSSLPFVGTIYHGVCLEDYRFNPDGGENLLMVGRIRKEKGIVEAIEVAKKTNMKLLICGEYFPQYPEIYKYWKEEVEPFIDGKQIVYNGLLSKVEMSLHYQKAKALLFPISWEEPFGLVIIEAMAVGTPIIAYNRGSVSEVIKDGVTGFIVDPDDEDRPSRGNWMIKKKGIEGLCEAVKRIGEIDRRACRRHVEENFTVEGMVERYEKVYEKVVSEVK